ncbi:MAG: sensor histidine kinase [Myxococcales bacterium]
MGAFDNLVSNAVKFCDDTKPVRTIKFTTQSAVRGDLVRTVCDNGVGFDLSLGKRIFEMFFRGHSGQVMGSGLGLYIAKKQVERLGGAICAVSCRNDTVFRVVIPDLAKGATP